MSKCELTININALSHIGIIPRSSYRSKAKSRPEMCREMENENCLFYLLLFYNFYNNMNLLINNKVGSEWPITTYRESGIDVVFIPQNYYHLLGFRNMMLWNVFLPIYDVLEWITTIVWWFGIFMFFYHFLMFWHVFLSRLMF